MRTVIFFLVVNLLWATSALAENQRSPSFPVLGYVSGNLLHVPTYRDKHEKIPEQLFAYGGGKEFIANLRKIEPFVVSDKKHDCYDSWLGHYVYETQPTDKTISVVIFEERKNIKFLEEKLTEVASNIEWEIFVLTTSEGGDKILRTKNNGRCVSHIVYSSYCSYATEPDSKQAFQSAMCGKKINGADTGF
jgi:hypothetical protein